MSDVPPPTESNVLQLKSNRTKRSRKDKPTQADIYNAILDAMWGKPYSRLADYPDRFHVVENDDGSTYPIRERQEGVCHQIGLSAVAASIAKYTMNLGIGDYALLAHQADQCAKQWLYQTTTVKDIIPVAMKSQEGLCWHRLPWDLVPKPMNTANCPIYAELFSRIGNAQAFMCFIGSLFYPDSDRQQYVWVNSEGGDGKGALFRTLQWIFQPVYKAEDANIANSPFWTWGILGARLVVFHDSNNASFPQSGKFKSLTGDDPVRVEIKGGAIFTAKLNAKFIVLSNKTPELSSASSDMRRVIYCEIKNYIGAPAADYEDKMRLETPDFIQHCMHLYLEMRKTSYIIPTDTATIENVVDGGEEEDFEIVFHRYFVAEKDDPDPYGSYQLSAGDVRDRLTAGGILDKKKQGNFKEYIKRVYNITRKRYSSTGRPCYYQGIRVKSENEGGAIYPPRK